MNEQVPTYGLLVINNAYNEGQITFLQWLELSREWALKMIERYEHPQADQDSANIPDQPDLQSN